MQTRAILSPPGMGFGTGRLGIEPESDVIAAVGRLTEFWGFRRALGQIWAHLYLAPEPRSAGDIAERLELSATAVATALGELQLWGAITRANPQAGRPERYSAGETIDTLIARLIADRELREVEQAFDAFTHAEESLHTRANEHPSGCCGQSGLDFQKARVGRLRLAAASARSALKKFSRAAPPRS